MKEMFANVSVKKTKIKKGNHNYATNLGKHLLRDTQEYYQLADPKQNNKNRVLINMEGPTLAKSLNMFLKKHKIETRNSTTVQAYQLVFSIPKELKNNKNAIEEFQKQVLHYVNTDPKFKDNCLMLVYHGDEIQPHIQGVFVPRTYDNTLNFKKFLGGLNGGLKLHKLHDDYHEAVGSKLGLSRGDGTHTTGMDHKRYLKAVGELAKPVAVPNPPVEEKKAVLPWNRIQQLEKENLVLRNNNIKLGKSIKKTLFYENQNTELQKANSKLRKINKNLEEKFMKISNEQKEKLREIPCEEVLQKLGFEITKDGVDYIRAKNHNINLVVNTETNKFTENKSMEQGFGAIDLLMKVFKFDFLETVRMLTNGFGSTALTKVALANPKITETLVKNNVEKIVREIPKSVPKNLPKIIDYLTNIRKIDKKIIDELISKNELYADKNNNCVFINGKFAFLRGTYQEKKFVSVAGEPDFLQYEFGKSTDTYIFESAIDALSFRTLYPNKDGKYLVVGGSMLINRIHEVVNQDSKLYLCFDSDSQGKKFCDKISSEVVNEVEIIQPKFKDFNEDLTNGNSTTKPNPTGIRNPENATGVNGKTKEVNSNSTNRNRKNSI
jgi:hypothetical protein